MNSEIGEGARLELVRENSGLRHFVAGRPVHGGDGLELQLEGGSWIVGRYEWSFREGTRPVLYVAIAGGGLVSCEIPETAQLRWPSTKGGAS